MRHQGGLVSMEPTTTVEFLCLACGTQGSRLAGEEVEERSARSLDKEPGSVPGLRCPRCGGKVLQLRLAVTPAVVSR